MEKLKPCPFCGGEVSMALTGHASQNWFFITRGHSKDKPNCKCRVFMNSERYFIDCMDVKEAQERAQKDLIKAWNTRAGEPIMIEPIRVQLTEEQIQDLIETPKKIRAWLCGGAEHGED